MAVVSYYSPCWPPVPFSPYFQVLTVYFKSPKLHPGPSLHLHLYPKLPGLFQGFPSPLLIPLITHVDFPYPVLSCFLHMNLAAFHTLLPFSALGSSICLWKFFLISSKNLPSNGITISAVSVSSLAQLTHQALCLPE